MKQIFLPSELKCHQNRLDPVLLHWLADQSQNKNQQSLAEFTDMIFELISKHEVIDGELAYMACKGGVMTGKLTKVIALGKSKHPAILAYQGLAYLFMNNFVKAEELIEKAQIMCEKIKTADLYINAEVQGIHIYLNNARYQFFQGVKLLQEMFDSLKEHKENIKQNTAFFQWIRISGAKSLLKLGYIQEAIYTNKRALHESGDDSFFRSFALLGLGHCFDMLGNTKKAIHYYKSALKLAYKIKAYNLLSIIFNRMGMTSAWRLDNIHQGETFFSEAIQHADKGEGIWLKEGPSWNLIALYRVRKDYEKAIKSLENIIEIARQGGESRTELIGLLNLGELLEEKGDLKEATKAREAAESLATLIGVELEDFYDLVDEEDEDLDYIEEEPDFIDEDIEIKTDSNTNPLNSDFFNLVEKNKFDINKLLNEEDDEFQEDFDEDFDEDLSSNSPEDVDDLVKKFFRRSI
jgi:tetratricopeptide (TPR) repeat protein